MNHTVPEAKPRLAQARVAAAFPNGAASNTSRGVRLRKWKQLQQDGTSRRQSTGRSTAELIRLGEGYCDTTDSNVRGDCDGFGSKGSLFPIGWSKGSKSAIAECAKLCAQCDRCRFLSFSLAYRDCSWFHACDTSTPLRKLVSGLTRY